MSLKAKDFSLLLWQTGGPVMLVEPVVGKKPCTKAQEAKLPILLLKIQATLSLRSSKKDERKSVPSQGDFQGYETEATLSAQGQAHHDYADTRGYCL